MLFAAAPGDYRHAFDKPGPSRAMQSEMKPALTFSVITPTLNRAHLLERALDSVRNQSVPALEHIVVDGGSTDSTLDILATYPDVTVLTGPDDGLYDAINKGIAAARGDVIVLLNDDDELMPRAIELASTAFEANPAAKMFSGSVIVDFPGLGARQFGGRRFQTLEARAQISGPNLFNGRFFRRTLFAELGGFDTRYRITADTELLARCLLREVTVASAAEPVYRYHAHQNSLTLAKSQATHEAMIGELVKVAQDHVSGAVGRTELNHWRRWLWWHSFAAAARFRSPAHVRRFVGTAVAHPMGMVAFLAQAWWHLRTFRMRRGEPLEPGSDGPPRAPLGSPSPKIWDPE